VTKRPQDDHNDTSLLTPATQQPTINPFYYGFNRLPRFSTTNLHTQSHTSTRNTHTLSTSTTSKYNSNSNNNNNNLNNSNNRSTTPRNPYNHYHYYFTTSKKPDLSLTHHSSTDDVDNNNYHDSSPTLSRDDNVEAEKPKSSTYNPVFDIYFKQIARQRTASP
jgi:hypothetical protein